MKRSIIKKSFVWILILCLTMGNTNFAYAEEHECNGSNDDETDVIVSEDVIRNGDIKEDTIEENVNLTELGVSLTNPRVQNGVSTWDCIWFGNYWQIDTNGDGKADSSDNKSPIKWRVLSVDNNVAMLISDQIITYRSWNGYTANSTWDTSDVRRWLNSYANDNGDSLNSGFCYEAFSDYEKSLITTKKSDPVSLLEITDVSNVDYGFISDNARKAVHTDYAAYLKSQTSRWQELINKWWLNSRVGSHDCRFIQETGSIYNWSGYGVDHIFGIRPVLYIDVSQGGYEYAGTVDSNGTVNPDLKEDTEVPNDVESIYIQEHLDFVNSSKFTERMDARWAEIISKGLDKPTGNFAEGFYHVLNSASEFLDCKSLGIFENPYDAVITELILKQSDLQLETFELSYKTEMYKNVENLEKLCKASSYSDEWSLNAEEYKTNLEKLIEDPKSMEEENKPFYDLCFNIFGELMEKEELDTWLKSYGKAGELIGALEDYANVVNWVSDCAKYTAMVEAYINTSDEFKATLLWVEVEMESDINDASKHYTDEERLRRGIYAGWYKEAVDKYCSFLTEEKIAEMLFEEYTENALKRVADVFGKTIRKNAVTYISEGLGLTKAAASWIFAAIEAYQTGWAISEAITDNGTIVECRELARASYYFADAIEDFVVDVADIMVDSPSLQTAKNFDAAYTVLQDVECYALENYMKYLRVQQESFVQGLLHGFSPYNFAEIENCKVLILEWQNACCHKDVPKAEEVTEISVVKVCCPTDVLVYDKNQNLVFSVSDNQVVMEQRCVTGCVVGDMKYIFLPNIEKYDIDVVATDNGKMSIFINSYSPENGALIKSTSYIQKDIAKEEIYGISYSYNEEPILSNGDNIITPTSVTENADDIILVTEIELEDIPAELYVGDKIIVDANVVPQNANCPILNWTSSDEEIVAVDEQGELVAKKIGEAKIVCNSIDGSGIYKELKIKVKDKTEDEKIKVNVKEVPTVENINYDSTKTLKDVALIGGIVLGQDGKVLNGSWSWENTNTVPTVNNSGYRAIFTPEDTRYYEAETKTIAVNVIPAKLSVKDVTAKSRDYDGTKEVVITKITLNGVKNNDVVSVNMNEVRGIISSANAGTYSSVTLPALTLMGEDAGNYILIQPSEAVTLSSAITINKTENTPNMPANTLSVLYSQKTVKEVKLPEGWVWSDADREKELLVDQTLKVTAIYNGVDQGNYE